MTQSFPRTNFNSSKLIRFLADLSVIDVAESKQAFAERLGQWLDFSDAITLHAAHSLGTVQAGVPVVAKGAIEKDLARTRTALVNSITISCSPDTGETRIRFPAPKYGTAIEAIEANKLATAYEPFRRFYAAHQNEMESGIRPLRAHVRKALTKASATLAQLAALDAALEKILGARERQLLATVPLLLEGRFGQLLAAHRERRADNEQADDPALWMQPGGWLAGFRKELQDALLAELDVRLQPTVGLIEAFSNEATRYK
jgi:hypothetical protein